jgi:hypothetical protein
LLLGITNARGDVTRACQRLYGVLQGPMDMWMGQAAFHAKAIPSRNSISEVPEACFRLELRVPLQTSGINESTSRAHERPCKDVRRTVPCMLVLAISPRALQEHFSQC